MTVAGIDRLRAEFNANAYSGRVEGGYRFVAPWMGGIGITPYAAGQFTTFDLPAYAEQAILGSNIFALAYGAKSVTDTRSELGLRTDKSFAAWERRADVARPCGMGARLQSGSRHCRHLPGAARRQLCRQRRTAGKRLRTDHRLRRNEMDEWLVDGGDV